VPSSSGKDGRPDILDAVWDVPSAWTLRTRLRFVRRQRGARRLRWTLRRRALPERNILARLRTRSRRACARRLPEMRTTSNSLLPAGACSSSCIPVLRRRPATDRRRHRAVDVTDERNAFRRSRSESSGRRPAGRCDCQEQALSRPRVRQEGLLVVDPTGDEARQHAANASGSPSQALVGAQFQDERWCVRTAVASATRRAPDARRRAAELFHGELCGDDAGAQRDGGCHLAARRPCKVEDVVISCATSARAAHMTWRARIWSSAADHRIVGTTCANRWRHHGSISCCAAGRTDALVGGVAGPVARRQPGWPGDQRPARLRRTRAPGGLPVILARAIAHDLLRGGAGVRSAYRRPRLAPNAGTPRFLDADRIEQALINLITNAIQYGGTAPVRVQSSHRRAHRRDQGPQWRGS